MTFLHFRQRGVQELRCLGKLVKFREKLVRRCLRWGCCKPIRFSIGEPTLRKRLPWRVCIGKEVSRYHDLRACPGLPRSRSSERSDPDPSRKILLLGLLSLLWSLVLLTRLLPFRPLIKFHRLAHSPSNNLLYFGSYPQGTACSSPSFPEKRLAAGALEKTCWHRRQLQTSPVLRRCGWDGAARKRGRLGDDDLGRALLESVCWG